MAAPNQPGRQPSSRNPGQQPANGRSAPKPAPKPVPRPAARPTAAAPAPAQQQRTTPQAQQPRRAAPPPAQPARKQAPPPNPQPADEPRGAAVEDAPRRSWFGRLVRLGVIALVLLFAALVTRSVVVDGAPDLTSEEGWISFVRSMFRSGRDLRDRSQNIVAQLKQEMGGVEGWLKERKIALPATDDLLKKADDMLNAARETVDSAMAPPVPTYEAPPKPPEPEPAPVQVAVTTPKPVAPVADPKPRTAPPPPPPVQTTRPEPTPIAAPKPVTTPAPITEPLGSPKPEPRPQTAPPPPPPPPVATKPAPAPVTRPGPGTEIVPVTVLPSTPAAHPEPAVAPAPPPPPANPALAEAQATFREGLEHYRNTRHGSPDMQRELRESARLFRKAQGQLEEAARQEPQNGKIGSLQVEVNRFLYDSLKRQTL